MAEISTDFRNIVGSKKCAVSSPRIVSLEIGDESPGGASESAFHGFFLNDQISRHDVESSSNLICGCDKQNDKNFLIHSQSPLSISMCNERPPDKIKSTNDIDCDLLDLLNSTKLEEASERGVENFNFKKNTSDDKMKIISNVEVDGGLSDLLSSIALESSEKDEVNATFEYCGRENTQDCGVDILDFDFAKNQCVKESLPSNNSSLNVEGNLSELLSSINIEDSDVTNVGNCNSSNIQDCGIDLLDFDYAKNECAKESLPSNNSSLNVEGNLSELLSSINIEDSDVTIVGNFNSSNMCNSKVVNKFKTEKEPPVADMSDLLSSIDLGNSNDNKVGSYNQGNMYNTKVVEAKNEPCVADLSDLLSSLDFGDCNNSKVGIYNQVNMCNTTVVRTKNESCLPGVLQPVDVDNSNKPSLALLNSKPLNFDSTNLFFNGTNDISDSLNDFAFDVSCSSSSNSCASSFSETENSPKVSLTKNNLLTDKESDSGFSSFDSAHKEFSFFDYSSDNQFSFNTLLTKKSGVNIGTKHDCEDARNTNEEMSMSDLLTVVSPEFKIPVLATSNKVEKHDSSVNEDCSSMLDLLVSLNIKSKNSDPDVISNNSVKRDEKLMDYDCVDGRISKKVQIGIDTINFQADGSLEKNILIDRNDILNDVDKIESDDEQITFIDLRECIKSAKHQFTPTSPIKQVKNVKNQSLECFSPNKIPFYCEEKSPSQDSSIPFEFNHTVPRKKIRVNAKQTMFSKALACKPKKDQFLLQKVANIKNELLTNIIYRPVFIDCDVPQPIIESVLRSDRCILPNVGRRSFGLDVPCELQ